MNQLCVTELSLQSSKRERAIGARSYLFPEIGIIDVLPILLLSSTFIGTHDAYPLAADSLCRDSHCVVCTSIGVRWKRSQVDRRRVLHNVRSICSTWSCRFRGKRRRSAPGLHWDHRNRETDSKCISCVPVLHGSYDIAWQSNPCRRQSTAAAAAAMTMSAATRAATSEAFRVPIATERGLHLKLPQHFMPSACALFLRLLANLLTHSHTQLIHSNSAPTACDSKRQFRKLLLLLFSFNFLSTQLETTNL